MRTLQVSADLDHLHTIRQFVSQTVQQTCSDQDFIYDLLIAVDEAVTNIIVHGYHEDHQKTINIGIENQTDGITVTLRDKAAAFDPTGMPSPDMPAQLSRRRLGGMGVFMMRASTDQMIYRRTPDGYNELKLFKFYP